jgi:hypothetical protein
VSPTSPDPDLSWLPQSQRNWAIERRAVLEAIFAAFARDGSWPDPVELERRLRSEETRLGVMAAVNEMPRSLGSVGTIRAASTSACSA